MGEFQEACDNRKLVTQSWCTKLITREYQKELKGLTGY